MDGIESNDTIQVVIWPGSRPPDTGMADEQWRDWREPFRRPTTQPVPVESLTNHFRVFIKQMETLLSETPNQLAAFELSELEVSAGLTASGQVVLFGVANIGGEVQGGLKFVFKKRPVGSDREARTDER